MTTRFMDVLYCDDIRREEGQKLSLMGVYGSELIAPSFPLRLPKFCLAIRLVLPSDEDVDDLRILLYKGDEEIASLRPDPELLAKADDAANNGPRRDSSSSVREEAPVPMKTIQVHAVLSPFLIEDETTIRVRAYGCGEIVRGQSLDVVLAADDESSG